MFFSRLSQWFARQTATGKGHTAAPRNFSRPARLEILESRRVLTSSIEAPGVADYEGDSGSKFFDFWVTLTQPISAPLDVAFSTADSNNWAIAEPGTDYAPVSGTLHFVPGGLTSQLVSVEVFGDTRWEPDEAFDVVFTPSDGSGAVRAEGFIAMDDAFPQLSIGDVVMWEGADYAWTDAVFTVTRAGATGDQLTVLYWVYDETAINGEDYAWWGETYSFVFEPGEITKTISIPVLGDSNIESDETFRVEIYSSDLVEITDGAGVGTILNDDPSPPVLIADSWFNEGDVGAQTANLEVYRYGDLDQETVVHLRTFDGTATAGADYTAIDQDVYFAPGEEIKSVPFTIYGDLDIEEDETFTFEIRGVSGAPLGFATATIYDNDTNSPPIASAGGHYVVSEWGNFALDPSATVDPDEGTPWLGYEWDLDYDGVTFDTNLTGFRPTVSPNTWAWTVQPREPLPCASPMTTESATSPHRRSRYTTFCQLCLPGTIAR
jgi:hypothetical protein